MKYNNNNLLDNELLEILFDESDLEIYFIIKNVEVKENDIVQLKGSPYKGDIIRILPDEVTVYVYWYHNKSRTLEHMKNIVWIKAIVKHVKV